MLKLKVLGFSGGGEKNRGLTSFLINNSILLDAGNVVASLTASEQEMINHIFVSHSHLDHIKDIPLICDNFVDIADKHVTVYGLEETINALKNNLFNNIIFPDFTVIPSLSNPVVSYQIIKPYEPVTINGITITAVNVNHTVPNVAYIVEDKDNKFVFISDTYITDEIYNYINSLENVKYVIIETSFPDDKQKLAEVSKHLTPELMIKEIEKIKDNSIKIYIYHLKPKFFDVIIEQIKSKKTNNHIEILKEGLVIEI